MPPFDPQSKTAQEKYLFGSYTYILKLGQLMFVTDVTDVTDVTEKRLESSRVLIAVAAVAAPWMTHASDLHAWQLAPPRLGYILAR